MDEAQKQKYTEEIVVGSIPDQESYNREEMRYIAQSILSWCALQIDHTWVEDMKHDDIPELVKFSEYKSIEEGIADVEEGMEQHIWGLQTFILDWFNLEK